MSDITNPSLKNTVRQYFQDLGEDAPTWTEIHGMLCALAVGPDVETVDYSEELEMPVPEDVTDALNRLRERLVTQLLGGDTVNLPCLLDPYQEGETADQLTKRADTALYDAKSRGRDRIAKLP